MYVVRSVFICLILFATGSAAADDIELLLDKNFGDKFLSEVSYPYTHVIYPSALALQDDQAAIDEAELSVSQFGTGDTEYGELNRELSQQLEEQLIDELMSAEPSYSPSSGTPSALFFKEMKNRLASELKLGDRAKVRAGTVEILKKDASLNRQFMALMRDWIKVDVRWVRVQVESKPASVISNPIVLSQLKLGVKANLRGCVRLGRWWCTGYFTVGYIRLEGRRLNLALIAAPPKLLGQPSFDDLDVVVKFRILGKTYKVKIGITKIVNKQLDPVTVVDLSDFEIEILDTGKELRIDSITPLGTADGLLVKANVKAVPDGLSFTGAE